jgi:predicted nucleotidyltransferase
MTAGPVELAALRTVADRLGPIREEFVFVGGMVRSLLTTDPGAPPARPTDDIDVVAAISSRAEYYALAERLRALGFREDHREKAPLCRWVVDGLTVDVMPDHENVLGFSNRWYPSARESATWHPIGGGPTHRIRVVDAPHFVATKLEAFRGRAGGDFYHHDMEDALAVVDGRAELLDELKASPESVRIFVAQQFQLLLGDDAFREAIPGHLPGDRASQARAPIVEERLAAVASLDG